MTTPLSRYADAPPYITKDGSEIRELLHPAHHGNQAQSLAEATIHPGQTTQRHRHHQTEELYHVTAGHGLMILGDKTFPIAPGDTIHIAPGTPHAVENPGPDTLRILCCCSPAYRHDDTEIIA